MSEHNYTGLVVVGVCTIIFDVLMLGDSPAVALGLGIGIMAVAVLAEFAVAALSDH